MTKEAHDKIAEGLNEALEVAKPAPVGEIDAVAYGIDMNTDLPIAVFDLQQANNLRDAGCTITPLVPAATIASLTAERDEAREQLQRQFDQTLRFQGYVVDQTKRAEAAEQQVATLREALSVLESICPRCGTESLSTVLQWRKEGMTLEAIAESVGITKGAVWQAIRKANRRREALKGSGQ